MILSTRLKPTGSENRPDAHVEDSGAERRFSTVHAVEIAIPLTRMEANCTAVLRGCFVAQMLAVEMGDIGIHGEFRTSCHFIAGPNSSNFYSQPTTTYN